MGRGREWGGRASHTVVPWTWEPGGKGNCSFFEKVGTAGPWTSGGTETKTKQKILLPALHRGKERRCSRRLPEKEQTPTSPGCPRQGPLRRLPGRLGAWLGRGGRHSPARGSTDRPMCRFGLGRSGFWRTQEGAHGDGQTEAWPGGSGGWCITPGQDVLDRLGLLRVPPRTAGRSPRRCHRTALPGRWRRRESVPCRRSSSLPGWARDGAPGPPWWTSPSRGTVPWLSSLVEQSQSPCAAPASTPGRYYPHAPVWAPWLGEPAG